MQQINDLKNNLEPEIDLSKSINLSLKLSKPKKKKLENLDSKNKNLNLKIKNILKIESLKKNNFDTIQKNKRKKSINLNNEKKEKILQKKLATTIFKLKNLKSKNKKIQKTKTEKHFFKNKFETKKLKSFSKNNFIENMNYFKIFFVIALVLFLGLLDKIIVETLIKTSYSNFLLIKDDFGNIKKTKQLINSSKNRLLAAEILFFPFSILPGQTVKNVNHIIDGGLNISDLMKKSIDLSENIDKKIKENGGIENLYLTDILGNIKGNYDEINKIIVKTYLEYDKISDLGDNNLNEKLKSVKKKLNLALINLDKINKNFDILMSILGENKEKKYLIVFQNNDEIRATGGFIGSMAILDLARGKVKNLEKKDVYALEWQINQVYNDKQKAPEGLNKITGTFGLRDANYFPEFRDTSSTIKFFLDKIDLKVDGIIYINQNVILDLIESVGGVYSETFQKEITKENFSLIVSTLVEAEVFRDGALGTPKQALFSFSEELFKKLNSEKKYYKYLKIILEHIETRDIVFYSFNPKENSFLWKMGVNGELNFKETFDFNFPVYTSIGGNKSDRYIDYRYEKTVKKIENSCDFLVNLKIFNTHSFTAENEQKVLDILKGYENPKKNITDIVNIQGKGENKSYLRVMVPKEAEIILEESQEQSIFEKYKTINLYTNTKPGETSNYNLKYRLKNEKCKNYSYKFFKQPGIRDYNILFDIFGKKSDFNNIKTDFIYKK